MNTVTIGDDEYSYSLKFDTDVEDSNGLVPTSRTVVTMVHLELPFKYDYLTTGTTNSSNQPIRLSEKFYLVMKAIMAELRDHLHERPTEFKADNTIAMNFVCEVSGRHDVRVRFWQDFEPQISIWMLNYIAYEAYHFERANYPFVMTNDQHSSKPHPNKHIDQSVQFVNKMFVWQGSTILGDWDHVGARLQIKTIVNGVDFPIVQVENHDTCKPSRSTTFYDANRVQSMKPIWIAHPEG